VTALHCPNVIHMWGHDRPALSKGIHGSHSRARGLTSSRLGPWASQQGLLRECALLPAADLRAWLCRAYSTLGRLCRRIARNCPLFREVGYPRYGL